MYGFSESGELELYGLAGRYYKDSDGITEFASLIGAKFTVPQPKGVVERSVIGPGKGKTTRTMPNENIKYLAMQINKKVLVAGPTRALCREISTSLRNKGFSTFINVQGERLRSSRVLEHQCASGETPYGVSYAYV